MTTQFLEADIRADEGFKLRAYPDPLSGGDPWTIGFGHTGSDVGPDTVWTADQALAALHGDIISVENGIARYLPWWVHLDDVRQDVLVNMGFELGLHGLLAFHNTLSFVEAGNYEQASANMLLSEWAKQVPRRAERLAMQMKTGVRAASLPASIMASHASKAASVPTITFMSPRG